MKEKMKKYLSILIAAVVLFGGMHMPSVVRAQENEGSQTAVKETVTVSTPQQFMQALEQKKSPITVSDFITVGDKAESDGRMIPVHIPAGTVIQGTGSGCLNFRCPVQLDGDGVCFKNIKMVFESTNALGSIPHREIFLAGHSLTLDNVNTYLKGGDSQFGDLTGTEKELLPTVYAGGYKNTVVGSGASLTVKNSNDETMFQAIYMGHDAGNDNNVPYRGNAVLNLDAKAIVREKVVASQNNRAEINIAGNENQFAKTKKFYGNENTTLTLNTVSIKDAIVDNVGDIVLKDKACLSPETEKLHNVTLQNGACLDFNNLSNVVISGNFIGEDRAAQERGILVLNTEGSLRVNGMIRGTTQIQTGHRLFPGDFLIDKTYIYANAENGAENNFTLAQKNIDNGYELIYLNGAWKIHKEQEVYKKIGRIEILSVPSKVNLNKIVHVESDQSPDENICFVIKWYDKGGQEFSSEEIEENGFYDICYVVPIRTDCWSSESITNDTEWHQPILLRPSEEEQDRYYMQTYGNKGLKAGDYTFLFCSEFIEEELKTVEDVKALKNTVKRTQRVIFYDQETDDSEHTHNYKGEITKAATCKETGLMTYRCDCGDKLEEKIEMTDHEYKGEITQAATCEETGLMTYRCVCGREYTEEIVAAGHKVVVDPAVKPTETTAGKTEGSHCSVCGEIIKRQEEISALGKPEHTHSYQSTVTKQATCTEKGIKTYTCSCGNKYTEEIAMLSHQYIEKVISATEKNDGKMQQMCQVCSIVKSTSVIYNPQKLTLSKTDYSYDGKVKTPSVTVKDSKGKNLKAGTDYQIEYSKGRKNPGVYTVAIELCGKYSGKMTGSFTIRPKKTSLKKVTARSKGMEVTWKKQATQSDGYQIQYCTSSNFKGKTLKTVTVKKNSTVKKISKLKGKKKYYVRIRTYKTVKVNGKSKKLYSDWSGKKTVSTKK